jgi:hypothetical protein
MGAAQLVVVPLRRWREPGSPRARDFLDGGGAWERAEGAPSHTIHRSQAHHRMGSAPRPKHASARDARRDCRQQSARDVRARAAARPPRARPLARASRARVGVTEIPRPKSEWARRAAPSPRAARHLRSWWRPGAVGGVPRSGAARDHVHRGGAGSDHGDRRLPAVHDGVAQGVCLGAGVADKAPGSSRPTCRSSGSPRTPYGVSRLKPSASFSPNGAPARVAIPRRNPSRSGCLPNWLACARTACTFRSNVEAMSTAWSTWSLMIRRSSLTRRGVSPAAPWAG